MTNQETERLATWINTVLIMLINFNGLFFITNTMFVIPMFIDRKTAWFKALAKTNPAILAEASASPIFRALDLLMVPANFLVDWWFIVIPALAGVGHLIQHFVTPRTSPGARVLLLAAFAGITTFLTLFHSTVAGLAGAILITNWQP